MITIQWAILDAEALAYLLGVAIGASLVCGVGLAMTWACRNRPAPVRRGTLLSVLTVVLASPAVVWQVGQHDLGVWRIRIADSMHHPMAARPATARTSLPPDEPIPPTPTTAGPLAAPTATLEPVIPSKRDLVEHAPQSADPERKDPMAADWSQYAGTLAAYTWAIGVFVGLLSLGRGWLLLRRLRTSFEPFHHPQLRLVVRQATEVLGLRQPPPVFSSSLVPLPLSICLLRPVVVLPKDLQGETGVGRLEAVLLHEMAHIAHRDLWVGLMQRAAGVLFWWNPLVHRVNARLADLREEIADNYVVRAQGSGDRFARLLVDFAARTTVRPRLPATIGVLEPHLGGLAGRVTRLLDRERNTMTRMTLTSIIAVVSAGLVLGGVLVVSSVQAETPSGSTQPQSGVPASADAPAPASPGPQSGEAATEKTLRGTVIDETGKAVAGARLWLPLRLSSGPEGRRMVSGTSGDDARFVLRFPAAWVKPGDFNPAGSLWVFSASRQLGKEEVYEGLQSDHPQEVAVTLGPPTDTSFVVLGPDNKPVAGALVEPWVCCRGIPAPEVRSLVGGRTDAEGRVKLPALPRNSLTDVQVTTEDLGIQHIEFLGLQLAPEGYFELPPQPAERALRLARTGRIEGRLIAERPELLRGSEIYVHEDFRARDERGYFERAQVVTGYAEVTPGPDGRFVVPRFAVGVIQIGVSMDRRLPFRPRLPFGSRSRPKYVNVEADKVTRVEIPLEQAVRVHGVVRIKQTGKPIVGALVNVRYGFYQDERVRTDNQGKFEEYVLPGEVRRSVVTMAGDYRQVDTFESYEVPAGVGDFDLPPIEVVPTVKIDGRLIDDSDRPVAGVRVIGILRGAMYQSTPCDKDGRFSINRAPLNIEFERFLVDAAKEQGGVLPARMVQKKPLILRVRLYSPGNNGDGARR